MRTDTPIESAATLLNRTPASLKAKARRLRISVTNARKKWTDRENQELMALYKSGMSIPDIATKMRRSTTAVHARVAAFRRYL